MRRVDIGDAVLPVSVSLGVAMAIAGSNTSATDLIAQADEAMYQAKGAGGNCAVFAPLAARAHAHSNQ